MSIDALGYLGISATNVGQWHAFLDRVLDVRVHVTSEHRLAATIDDWVCRIIVDESGADDIAYIGWEVRDLEAIDRLRRDLTACEFDDLTEDECATRSIAGGVQFSDPNGVRTELFFGPRRDDRPVGGFRTEFVTGHLGLGHVVLGCNDLAAATDFYVRVLGFRITDTCILDGDEIHFLRCNQRHHSLALAGVDTQKKLLHFMVETVDLDSVGQGFGRFAEAECVKTVIGRHSNDHMVSFYGRTPSGFSVEFGACGRLVDAQTHVHSTYLVESAWGHHPFAQVVSP